MQVSKKAWEPQSLQWNPFMSPSPKYWQCAGPGKRVSRILRLPQESKMPHKNMVAMATRSRQEGTARANFNLLPSPVPSHPSQVGMERLAGQGRKDQAGGEERASRGHEQKMQSQKVEWNGCWYKAGLAILMLRDGRYCIIKVSFQQKNIFFS